MRNGLSGSEEASLNAKRLLHYFREKCLPVIHVQHINDDVSTLTTEQKANVKIHQNVEPIEGETVIIKKTPGSFKEERSCWKS